MKIPKARRLDSGQWFIQLRLQGRSISITQPTKKLAEAEAAACKAGLRELSRTPERMTVRKAYEQYLELKAPVLSPSTMAGYTRLSRNTLQGLMPLRLSQLTSPIVQREISLMAAGGASPKYIANATGLLSAVLRLYAPELHLDLSRPAKRRPEPRIITRDELQQLLQALKGTAIELPVLMALWMGMRMSEVRGARFKDLRAGRLHICNAIVDSLDGPAEKQPKTFKGDRWITVPPYILGLMEQARQQSDSPYIVPMSNSTLYKRFSRLLEDNGIEHCRFHDLRHANAAVMMALHVDSKCAQERNGWASDRMYREVYSYTTSAAMAAADKALDGYFAPLVG